MFLHVLCERPLNDALHDTLGNSTKAAYRHIDMPPRSMPAPVMAVLLAAVLGSCSSNGDPYNALSSEATQYVIPGSEDWTSGELCPDGGDCGGPITVSAIERYDWYRITDLTVAQGESTQATVRATLSVEEARSAADSGSEAVSVQVWGPDVAAVKDGLGEGFETWAGVDSENNHYAVVFAAFDTDGRLAGIGNAAAEYFTIPVAQLAAQAQAPSGFAYLDPIMTR